MFIRPNIIRSVHYPNHGFSEYHSANQSEFIPVSTVKDMSDHHVRFILLDCTIVIFSYNECGRRVTVQLSTYFPLHICVDSQRGIYSCIKSLGYVDLAELIRLQMKSQLMFSKCCLFKQCTILSLLLVSRNEAFLPLLPCHHHNSVHCSLFCKIAATI